jgi:hypothetical protein
MADDAPDPSGFSLILHYSPEMVAELALGADHPHEIAERYGVDPVDYEHLASLDWFQRLVVQKRTEFHDTGVMFTAKAGMMAEALLTRLFQQSMAGTIAAPLTVEVAKQLTDIGRLKPQPINTSPGSGGGAFQINIQVGGTDVVSHDPHAGLVAAPVAASSAQPDALAATEPSMSLDFNPPKGQPPAVISGLKMPDFDVRHPLAPRANAAAFGGGVASPPAGPSRSLDPQPGASVTPGLPPTPGRA